MHIYQIWIIAGIICLILEIFIPGFFVAAIGIGAFFASPPSAASKNCSIINSLDFCNEGNNYAS